LRGICTALERDAIPSPGGKTRWTAPGVRHILTRPTYSGAAVAYRHRHERRPDGGYAVRPASEAEMITVLGIAEPIVSPEEQATVRNRLAVNQAQSRRNNRMPERSLLRCGVARCGYCGRSLGVKNPTPYRPDGPPRYYCKFPDCLRPTITTTMIDDAVWARLSEVLLHPEIITSEVAKHRQDGGLERDLATVETRLAGIAAKQTKTARAIARVDDDAAEPLYVELHTLSEQKKAAERERDDLHRRIADHAEEDQRVRHLEDWCQTVSENLDGLTYDERRMALDALGVRVAIYRPGAVDSTGQALPRWVMTIDPGAVLEPSLLSHSTRRTRATSFWAAASWP
jgi:site-specific DNA recombinase